MARIHGEFYYPYLFGSSNTVFTEAYKRRWNEVRQTLFSDMHAYLENFRNSSEARGIDKSWEADDRRWGIGWAMKFGRTVTQNVDSIEAWFDHRQPLLDSLISRIGTTDGIESVEHNGKNGNSLAGKTYNVWGRQVAPDTKGIVIRGGHKYVNK